MQFRFGDKIMVRVLGCGSVVLAGLVGVACGDDSTDGAGEGSAGAPGAMGGSSADQDEDEDPAGEPEAVTLPEDPAPEFNTAGSYGCDGCPESDVSTDPVDAGSATFQAFSGIVTGALGDGRFYLVTNGGDGEVGGTRAIAGTIPTSASGGFAFTVPLYCGKQLIKSVWENEVGTYVLVQEVETTDCVEPEIRLTLTWDELGRDFELHFIKEGGQINDNATDCTWTSCIGSSPDWGAQGDDSDNPRKDVDNVGNYGPENIFLSSPESGTYDIMVEHWGVGDPLADGIVYIGAGAKSYIARVDDLAPQHVWHVGKLEWPSGDFTPMGEKIDCTTDWSGGCRLDIPQ